jgi:transposase
LNLLSAVNRRGRIRFMIEKGGLNAGVICRFLDRLMAGSSKAVFLILDGHPMHKSGKVAEKVKSYKGRLRLYLLPPYSPELNPDEGVWREVKSHRLGRTGVFSLADMKSGALEVCIVWRTVLIKSKRFFVPKRPYMLPKIMSNLLWTD